MPNDASNGSLMVMTYVKAVVALIVVGTLAYCTIMQIPIEGTIEKLILAILAGKELVSARVYYESGQNNRQRKAR